MVTTNSISSALLLTSYQLNNYPGLFLTITDNIGNVIVFCSNLFRNRAYSIYLLSEIISDFLDFSYVLVTRIRQKGFQISIIIHCDIICELRQFISLWVNQLSFILSSFVIIDRLLSTKLSNRKFDQTPSQQILSELEI